MEINSLRKLLVLTRSLDILSGDVVRRMLCSVIGGAVQDHSVSGRIGVLSDYRRG